MMPLWGFLDDEATGTLNWYINLPGEYQAGWNGVLGINGSAPSPIPLTWPFDAPVAWPEAWRHTVLDAVLRGVTPGALASSWDLGLYGSGADYSELSAPGYTRIGLGTDPATDIAASGDPVAGVRGTTAHTWTLTLTAQDLWGVVLYGDGTEAIRSTAAELFGTTSTATVTVDTYSGTPAFGLTGPAAWTAPVLDTLVNGGSYTPPSAHYLGFLEAFAFTPTEVTGGGYSRKPISFGAPSSGQCTNTAAITWTATGTWPTATWAVWDAPSGGTLLWLGVDGSISPMYPGDRILVDVGAIKARLL